MQSPRCFHVLSTPCHGSVVAVFCGCRFAEQISSSPGMRLPCRQAAVLRSQGMRPVSTLPITTPCLQVAVLHARGQNKVGHPTPSILALSRQGMPNLPGTSVEGVEKGGYIVHGGDEKPDVILLSTGETWQPGQHVLLSGMGLSGRGFPLGHSPLCRQRMRLILGSRWWQSPAAWPLSAPPSPTLGTRWPGP